jgi:L-ascorbate metabolism protein UlaG (beta-lactamase superfamily)
VARRGLPRAVPILTTPKAARALLRQGFRAPQGLTTWESTTLQQAGHTLTVTAAPGRHATGPARHLLPPVMGSVLDYAPDGGRALRVYITGDTLFVDDLRDVPRRFPDIDVAVLHLGGTTLPGGLIVTMDAGQGCDLLELVRPRTAVPIHNDDYGVFASPLSAFLAAAADRGLRGLVRVVWPGETIDLLETP